MIVDYDWIQVLLDGKLNTNQYNTAGQLTDTSSSGRVSFVDLVFSTAKNLIYPWFILYNEDQAGNTVSPFTYSLSAGGPFVKNLEVRQDLIVGGRTVRVYIKTANNYNINQHPTAKLRLTPGGNWNPPIWRSATFGYDLFTPPSDAIKFRYFSNDGVERSAGDINNHTIASLIVTLNLPNDTFPNTSFTLSGTGGDTGLFTYSFSSTGVYAPTLTWNVGNAVNGTSVRVYVKFNDPQDGERRAATQLKVEGNIAGQWRTAVSAYWGAMVGKAYWLRPPQQVVVYRARVDDSGWVSYNLRTGVVTAAVNDDRRSYTEVCNVSGVDWAPGIRGTGYENYHSWVKAARTFPAAANPGITRAKSFRAYLSTASGRNTIRIEQQPTAANDYTVIAWCRDGDDGPGSYAIGLGIEIT